MTWEELNLYLCIALLMFIIATIGLFLKWCDERGRRLLAMDYIQQLHAELDQAGVLTLTEIVEDEDG